MRRLDHSMIFVLIAGTYTPFCLLVLTGALGTATLITVWAGAAVGVATKFYRVDLHVLSGFMYIGLGLGGGRQPPGADPRPRHARDGAC